MKYITIIILSLLHISQVYSQHTTIPEYGNTNVVYKLESPARISIQGSDTIRYLAQVVRSWDRAIVEWVNLREITTPPSTVKWEECELYYEPINLNPSGAVIQGSRVDYTVKCKWIPFDYSKYTIHSLLYYPR